MSLVKDLHGAQFSTSLNSEGFDQTGHDGQDGRLV